MGGMKARSPILILAAVALGACSSPAYYDSSFDFRPGLPIINRNGNIVDYTKVDIAMDKACRLGTAADMDARISGEKPFLLYLYGNSCSHCEDIHNVVVGFIEKFDIEVFAIESNQIHAQMDPIANAYPGLGISTANYRTPTLYLIKGPESCADLNIATNAQTIDRISQAVLPKINLPYSYTFRSTKGFSSFLEAQSETYVYFESKENDRGRAELGIDVSARPVGIVESSKFGEDEWTALTTLASEESLEGKVGHYEKEKGFTSFVDYAEVDEAFRSFLD